MSQRYKRFYLLVVRDGFIFTQIWHEVYEFLLFQEKKENTKKAVISSDILGVFFSKSALALDKLCLINSFGLSGSWSLYEINPHFGLKVRRLQCLQSLLKILLHKKSGSFKKKKNVNQKFIPVFKEKSLTAVVLKSFKEIEEEYLFQMKKYLVLNDKTGTFRFGEI